MRPAPCVGLLSALASFFITPWKGMNAPGIIKMNPEGCVIGLVQMIRSVFVGCSLENVLFFIVYNVFLDSECSGTL